MKATGWIALSRDIERHWIWLEPRRFQMWVKMIFLAHYADTVVPIGNQNVAVNRGEFVTSMRRLSAELCCSKPTAIRFLQALETDGMISCRKDSKFTVISITNYDLFQPTFPTIEKRSKSKKTETTLDRKVDRRFDHIIKKEKNITKEKIYFSLSRESDFELFKEMMGNENFFIETSEALGIDVPALKDMAEQFRKEKAAKEKFSPTASEFRSHFFNFVKFEIERGRAGNRTNQQSKSNQNASKYESRRGSDVTTQPGDVDDSEF